MAWKTRPTAGDWGAGGDTLAVLVDGGLLQQARAPCEAAAADDACT